jgi:hypothetical protein
MEASFVVPSPLDVAGTLSRFDLWGEDPAARSGLAPRLYGLHPAVHHDGRGACCSAVASGALDLDCLAGSPNVEVIE